MTSRRAIVTELFGIAIAIALTAGVAGGVALQLQQGFEPVYEAQKESSIRLQHEASAQRAREQHGRVVVAQR